MAQLQNCNVAEQKRNKKSRKTKRKKVVCILWSRLVIFFTDFLFITLWNANTFLVYNSVWWLKIIPYYFTINKIQAFFVTARLVFQAFLQLYNLQKLFRETSKNLSRISLKFKQTKFLFLGQCVIWMERRTIHRIFLGQMAC